jgi:phosphoribosyl 1,2-cyclic phosphodiesterase
VAFAVRADAQRLILFHHDPTHDDDVLDELAERATTAWIRAGRDPAGVTLAAEGTSIEL